ncbi:bifunctional 5,10-methylenetetrahydrofolate dehydrogenase/5,10-methenyltetrahydrofolate cyclohydrolase [Candidatus Bipolaricaulota bacterium]|nr:bifunctional 5,10-methylenetetrahydrofolate dehydrogenase/5,10-methenyltetrahydrofolate cyclohydrolase [Candidatus Bipolaricaulota bacterium]
MALLSTKLLAETLDQCLVQRDRALRDVGVVPTLAAVLVKGDEASEVYFRSKRRLAKKLGIAFRGITLPADATTSELLRALRRSAEDPSVHGVFLEMPLPSTVDAERIRNAVPLEKDVDCVSDAAIGRVLTASSTVFDNGHSSVLPATPLAVMELLRRSGIPIAGKHAVVVGRSFTVGRPLALLLLAADATVTVCHSRTPDLSDHTRRADILCVAAGRPHLIGKDHVRKGAVLIDIGIHSSSAGLVGDIDTQAVVDHAAWVTPVPGGVGALTTRMIFANMLSAAESSADPRFANSDSRPQKEPPSS